ncbi:DUF882 domain-containing protein [Rhizobium paknamense]|uniref:Murein endopeptidase K n=1 Tax=Rhizobium paknamense TaxID=1206817 RepID=A0ABU0IKC6_9HYPH|nr:DUF882 domain-containing protein [Rhizobium paknamense]MDQ0458078.1 uncharacterized protein YcbK (DUF882 family) [Rhizobium paknamense]
MRNTDVPTSPSGHERSCRAVKGGSAVSRLFLTAFLFLAVAIAGLFSSTGSASAETRSLRIYFVHTGEKQEITYKRNGRYDPKGLQQLNTILRDWRRNEATKMDPRLFDLVWNVYQKSGASGYIYVVSGYRSPQTNAMLRSRSAGVAKESQHMRGTAMDFFIPGVALKTLRDIGLKMQAGGVGYYPNSGSPFVHMDVAGVRSWPRVPRDELVRLFPDGKTLHIPADGKPLPGYDLALAEYKRRLGSEEILMADSSPKARGRPRNLMAMLFGGGDEDEDEDSAPAPTQPQRAQTPPRQPELTNPTPPPQASVAVASAQPSSPAIDAPVPLSRPAMEQGPGSLAVALYSPGGRNAAEDALQKVAEAQPRNVPIPISPDQANAQNGYADLASYKIPVPTLLDQRSGRGEQGLMTASLAPGSLPPVEDGVMHIPVPAGRPALADAMAATQPQSAKEPTTVEEAMLSPAAADALDRSMSVPAVIPAQRPQPDFAATPANAPVPSAPPAMQPAPTQALALAAPGKPQPQMPVSNAPVVVKQSPPQQVASLAPAKPRNQPGNYGDVFDQPKPVAKAAEPGLPVKGARPGPSEAEAANLGLPGGNQLTRTMVSQWALNKGEATAPKSGKSGRVVPRAIISTPAEPDMPVGLNSAPPIDPARFGAIR